MIKKNGWGLTTELFIIMGFLLCLIIAIIGIKKFGLYSGEDINKKTDYALLENSLINATKQYVSKSYGNNFDDVLVIRVSHLVRNSYMNPIKDNIGNVCSGYVEVRKDKVSVVGYEPFINCPEYKTNGYDINKDW